MRTIPIGPRLAPSNVAAPPTLFNAVFDARSTTNFPFTVLAVPTAAFAKSAVIPAIAKPKLPQMKFQIGRAHV